MARFVQQVGEPGDPYVRDITLRGWLTRVLGDEGAAAAHPRLAALGTDVAGRLRAAHLDAETHPPVLHRYDPYGARVDRIETAIGWARQRQAAVEHGLVSLPYRASARAGWGAGARVVQHALLHLYGPESATFSCPVAMTDGAAALLSRPDVPEETRRRWLPRLVDTDPDTALFSGQWMTESQGGSDIARSSTVARDAGDGSWRLTGEKWFCSAADAQVAIALARPDGAPAQSSRVLVPFLVPRYAAGSPLAEPDAAGDAPAPGVRVHRLKDKLGTRALPTAEIGLTNAWADPIGDPGAPGLGRMMTLVLVTRLHNAAAAASGMRRGLDQAIAYARRRQVAGGVLTGSPLHRATLATLDVHARAAFALAGHGFHLLGRVEVDGDRDAAAQLRLVAPLAKLLTGRLAVAAASEYIEAFGGSGYVEDTGVPRLLRDAQVLPIWEGTTNVLSLDVLRALRQDPDQAKVLTDRLGEAEAALAGLMPELGAAAAVATGRLELVAALAAAGADPGGRHITAGARELAVALADALAVTLLAEHAVWADRHHADPGSASAAALYALDRLAHRPVAARADRHFDSLTSPDSGG